MADESNDAFGRSTQCLHFMADKIYDQLAELVYETAKAHNLDHNYLMSDVWKLITRDQFNWPAMRRPSDISYEVAHLYADYFKSSQQFRDVVP